MLGGKFKRFGEGESLPPQKKLSLDKSLAKMFSQISATALFYV